MEQERLYPHLTKVNILKNANGQANEENIELSRQWQPLQEHQQQQQHTSNKNPSWNKLLVLIGFATTFGTAVPVGYCIGVINSPSAVSTIRFKLIIK